MTAKQILAELQSLGSASYKNLLMRNHGVQEPCFGVKIGDMKPIVKRIKKDHTLALDLYATGNYDAMYLAGLIADDSKMSGDDLDRWLNVANGGALAGSTLPWVAAGSPHGWKKGLEWIEAAAPEANLAGWHTLANIVALKPDQELDLKGIEKLLGRIRKQIKSAPDLARYGMNSFLIAVGTYIADLHETALQLGTELGELTADLGNNSCAIPYAPDYLKKVASRGSVGKKRKSVKC